MADRLRIEGLISGINTQETIDKIMKSSRGPLERLKKQQQLLIWKQEAYRAQNTAISQLRDLVFNLKLNSTFQTKIANSSNSQVATASVGSSAPSGTYNINVTKLADAAVNSSYRSVSIRSSVKGDVLTDPVTITTGVNDQFSIVVDGVQKDITLDEKAGGYTVSELADHIQAKLNSAGFSEPIFVKATEDKNLVFYAGKKTTDGAVQTLVLKNGAASALAALGFDNGATSKELIGSIIGSDTITVDNLNKSFKISVAGGVSQTITTSLANGTYSLADYAADIQTQIQALGGEYAKVKVDVTDFKQLKFTYVDPSDPTKQDIKLDAGTTNDILGEMGFGSGAVSDFPRNNINTSSSIWNQRDKFLNSTFFADKTDQAIPEPGKTNSFGFVINGQSFTFSYRDSLDTIINEINGNAAAGVTAHYDDFNDKLVFTSNKVGDNNEGGAEIQFNDPNGVLTQLFNIDQSKESGGTDAVLTINGVTTQKKTNSFSLNNVNFTLNSTGSTTVTVNSNNSGISTKIEEFVKKYNEVIASINTELTESRVSSGSKYKFYEPLTDEQRKGLSEEEIKLWEDKAKQGILRNDSILSTALRECRLSLSRVVDNPITVKGLSRTGIIDFTGANRFKVTYGSVTKEIVMDELAYDLNEAGDANSLKNALQKKLDVAFGNGAITVGMTSSNALTFTSNNVNLTFNDGATNNGLERIGLSNGAKVSASYNRLSQIGITTGSYLDNGKLNFDKAAFENALTTDPDGVMRLLTNFEAANIVDTDSQLVKDTKKAKEEASKGIFYKLHEILNTNLNKILDQAGSTGTAVSTNNLGKELIRINDKIEDVEDRLEMEENRLWKQFTMMEQALARMNSQSSWLTSILGGGQ